MALSQIESIIQHCVSCSNMSSIVSYSLDIPCNFSNNRKSCAKSEETVWSGFKDYYYPLLRRELQLYKAIVEANSQVRCQVCGSVAENLEAPGPKNIGDLDVMIFSIAENLIIHEKIIEYFAESPLHVRIKGIQNPTLQSCLVQSTEYVATSTLRNYHPAIFPSSVFQALPFSLNIILRFQFQTFGP